MHLLSYREIREERPWKLKRGSLLILSHYFFICVSPTLYQTLGGIIRGRRKKALLRFLDKRMLKLFCINSIRRFFRTGTGIARLYFFFRSALLNMYVKLWSLTSLF